MRHIDRPGEGEYASFALSYINCVPDGNVLEHLEASAAQLKEMIGPLTEAQLQYRYAPGKWSIKEVLAHLIDGERVFAYRALRIARNDKTALPGFDENSYAAQSFADSRSINDIMGEYDAVRSSTLFLFKSLPEETAERSAIVNGRNTSVRALAYIIAGHELHHISILRERYLDKIMQQSTQ